MYQALYRKYRPRTFDDVAGQGHITETLKNQAASNRLSHAYLFVGTRGTGKTSCAKILARAVNCEHPVNGNPCNECPTCRSIESGASMDVLELDAASNNGVDNVRALREEAAFTPSASKKRVYIIDEVHMLSVSAFNALLKILEEPPEYLMFILATTELHKVPATILSRCQRFSFRRISREDIQARVEFVADAENILLRGNAAPMLARLADGAMRDALSLLDQCAAGANFDGETRVVDEARVRDVVGLSSQGETGALFRAIVDGDAQSAFTILDALYKYGKGIAPLFDELAEYARDALVLKLLPDGQELLSGATDPDFLREINKTAAQERIMYILDSLLAAKSMFTRGQSDRAVAELRLAALCDSRLDTSLPALLSRVSELEQGRQTRPVAPVAEQGATPAPIRRSEPPEFQIPVPVSDDEPIRESVPKPPEPEPEPEPEDSDDGELWRKILLRLGAPLSFTLAGAAAEMSEGVLKLSAPNAFIENMLKNDENIAAVRAAAEAELGRGVTVKVSAGASAPAKPPSPKSATPKLDDLAKFSNVSFED
jgi:DNA polymerase-3 subunit gamma/tau